MGRVARYKKVRSFDPYAKGGGLMANDWGFGNSGRKPKKRSKTAERLRSKKNKSNNDDDMFDAAPNGEDDFDLSDFMVKKEQIAPSPLLETKEDSKAHEQVKVAIPSFSKVTPLSLEQEKREAKILKIDLEKKAEPSIVAPRMEGESKKAFHKRMKAETKRIICNEKIVDNRNPEKKQKKKEFMNQKKKKKKGGVSSEKQVDDLEDSRRHEDLDILVTGERAAQQQIAFGEQAQRPPEFKHLPRGATPKNKANIKRKPGMSADQQHAESRAMEQMRAKVQAQYALMKAQRKRDGDFHL